MLRQESNQPMTGELALLHGPQCQNNKPYLGVGELIQWLFTGYAVLSGP